MDSRSAHRFARDAAGPPAHGAGDHLCAEGSAKSRRHLSEMPAMRKLYRYAGCRTCTDRESERGLGIKSAQTEEIPPSSHLGWAVEHKRVRAVRVLLSSAHQQHALRAVRQQQRRRPESRLGRQAGGAQE